MTKKAKTKAETEADDFLREQGELPADDQDDDDKDAPDDDDQEEEEEEEEEEKDKKEKPAPVEQKRPALTLPDKRLKTKKPELPTVAYLKGRFGRFRLPVSMDISAQMLPPITKRSLAMYELVDFFDTRGGKKIDPRIVGGNNEIDPPPYELVDNYQFHDRWEPDLNKRDKILTFHGGIEKFSYKNPFTQQEEIGSRAKRKIPFFTNGRVQVEIEKNYPQFVWWELHPNNASNKFRDKQKPAIFRRIDLDFKSPHVALMRMDLQQTAYNYVRNLDKTKLNALASALTKPTISLGLPEGDLRLALLERSRANPEEVLYSAPDKHTAACMDILNSLDFGIIDFNAQSNSYSFSNMPEEIMYTVPMEEKQVESLAKFLTGQVEGREDEGKESYALMKDLVSFWEH